MKIKNDIIEVTSINNKIESINKNLTDIFEDLKAIVRNYDKELIEYETTYIFIKCEFRDCVSIEIFSHDDMTFTWELSKDLETFFYSFEDLVYSLSDYIFDLGKYYKTDKLILWSKYKD